MPHYPDFLKQKIASEQFYHLKFILHYPDFLKQKIASEQFYDTKNLYCSIVDFLKF